MRDISWKEVILWGIIYTIFPVGTIWAVATRQPWTWLSASIVIIVLLVATVIYTGAITVKYQNQKLDSGGMQSRLARKPPKFPPRPKW